MFWICLGYVWDSFGIFFCIFVGLFFGYVFKMCRFLYWGVGAGACFFFGLFVGGFGIKDAPRCTDHSCTWESF